MTTTVPITDALTAERNLDAALPAWALRQEDRRGPFWKWTTSTAEWQIYMLDGQMLRLKGSLVDVMLPVSHCAAMLDLAVSLGAIEREELEPRASGPRTAPFLGRCNTCRITTCDAEDIGKICPRSKCDGVIVDFRNAAPGNVGSGAPVVGRCNRCRATTWIPAAVGHRCNADTGNHNACNGTLVALEGSPS